MLVLYLQLHKYNYLMLSLVERNWSSKMKTREVQVGLAIE